MAVGCIVVMADALRSALPGAVFLISGLCSLMVHLLSARHAFGAAADRSIQTPTSSRHASTAQLIQQPEEYPQVGIPTEQPIYQPPTAADDLARQPHNHLQKRLQFQAD